MTVFTWTPREVPDPQQTWSDKHSTFWAEQLTRCVFCDCHLERGQRVWSWDTPRDAIIAHADCVKQHARGIIKDFDECLR